VTYAPAGVEAESTPRPSAISLWQNYPNPFNPSTTIRFSVPENGHVRLKVYNLLGAEIATLVDERKPAGTYAVTFRAESLPTGVYLYQLSVGQTLQTRRMVLIR